MKTLLLCALASILFATESQAQTAATPIVLKDAAGAALNTYATLQSAYDAIPATITQSYTIEISGLYSGTGESFPIVFTEKAGASSINRIAIKPVAAQTGDIFGPVINAPMMILDGADWLFFEGPPTTSRTKQLSFNCDNDGRSVPSTFAAYPAVELRNGATHNVFAHCQFRSGNIEFNPHEAPALLFAGTNNGEGNDSNSVINCTFLSSDNMLAAIGNPAVPNKGIHVANCNFNRIGEDALNIGEGNSGFTLDGNTLSLGHDATWLHPQSYGITVAHLADTCRIRGNKFTYRLAADSNVTAISLTNTTGTGYALIANNAIHLGDYYSADLVSAYSTATTRRDVSNYPTGLVIGGSGLIRAGVFHNTIRFNRNFDSASAVSGFSDCFRYTGTNAGNQIDLKNNLFLNTRSGGAPGSAHLAMNLLSTLGILADYNVYSPGATIKAAGTNFSSFVAWQAAYAGQDVHSNDSFVLFETTNANNLSVSDTFFSVRLSAAMYLLPWMKGVQLSTVSHDISGNERLYPYRGCTEINPACSLAANTGSIFTQPFSSGANAVCAGASIWLRYIPAGNNNSILHQWQQRAAIASTFTDLPGETGTDLLIAPSGDVVYRVKDSCVAGGSAAAYSAEVPVSLLPPAVSGSLSEVHVGNDYTFTVAGSSGVTGFYWEMGDGNSLNATDTVLTYTYTAPGTYQVKVFPQGCSAAMLQRTVEVWAAGIGAVPGKRGLEVYPNPVREQLWLKVTGSTIYSLELVDQMGRMAARIKANNERAVLDVRNVQAGYYVLRIQTDKGMLFRPVSVVH